MHLVHVSDAGILQLNLPYLLLHRLLIHSLSHWSGRLDVSQLRVHHNVGLLLVLQRQSRDSVINISIDQVLLIRRVSYVSTGRGNTHLYKLAVHVLSFLGTHRLVCWPASIVHLDNFVQAVIEVADFNLALSRVIGIQRC